MIQGLSTSKSVSISIDKSVAKSVAKTVVKSVGKSVGEANVDSHCKKTTSMLNKFCQKSTTHSKTQGLYLKISMMLNA